MLFFVVACEINVVFFLHLKKNTDAALDEIDILDTVTREDTAGDCHVVRLFDHFIHRGPHGSRACVWENYSWAHVECFDNVYVFFFCFFTDMCLVFEMLGDNLLTLIKANKYRGTPAHLVRTLVRSVSGNEAKPPAFAGWGEHPTLVFFAGLQGPGFSAYQMPCHPH